MSWPNLKGEFQVLLNDALALKRETRALRQTVRLLVDRGPLDRLGGRIDQLSESFSQADTRLAQAGALDVGINGLIMEAAAYAIVASARESVRTVIHEAYADLSDLRSALNNTISVALGLAAILVSVVAIILGVG